MARKSGRDGAGVVLLLACASGTALAGGFGPLLAGQVFDRTGDYSLFLIAGTVISLISGALVFSLGTYPDWSTPKGDAA